MAMKIVVVSGSGPWAGKSRLVAWEADESFRLVLVRVLNSIYRSRSLVSSLVVSAELVVAVDLILGLYYLVWVAFYFVSSMVALYMVEDLIGV